MFAAHAAIEVATASHLRERTRVPPLRAANRDPSLQPFGVALEDGERFEEAIAICERATAADAAGRHPWSTPSSRSIADSRRV
jgi:hypothetical protein